MMMGLKLPTSLDYEFKRIQDDFSRYNLTNLAVLKSNGIQYKVNMSNAIHKDLKAYHSSLQEKLPQQMAVDKLV